jgi:serine/threonine-protein kinase
VALKFAHMAERRADLLVRLARERHLLAALDHPNVARLYDAGVTPQGQPYLVLEYVEGEPLDEYCARREPGLPQRLGLFLQIADAVAHAHERQIVHRDLKPANVLVTAQGQARLLDFGIGQLLSDGLPQGLLLSMITGRPLTLAYASPEQVLGDQVGFASDVYSLGVMLYELLTGSRPFEDESTRELREAVLFGKPQPPSALCEGPSPERRLRRALDEVALQALSKRRQQRQASARVLAEQVARALGQR